MNMRDDPMWDDFKYWIKNPLTEEELAKRESDEKAYIDAVMDRVYGKESRSFMTGGAAPVVKEYLDKNGNVYQADESGKRLLPTKNFKIFKES